MMLILMILWIQASVQEQPLQRSAFCDVVQKEEVLDICTSCAVVATSACPRDQSKVRTVTCTFMLQIGGRQVELSGCQQVCERTFKKRQCCLDHWGPLCLPCPQWSGKTCNSHGNCVDGDHGNGTCICDENFSGFACQECKNPNAFGSNCDKECDCVHGVCNNGPDGDGQCWCQPPYNGEHCNQVSSSCRTCPPYSYCKGLGDAAICECLPRFTMTTAGACERTCSESDCNINAQCSSDGSKVTCTCKPQYVSEGSMCLPRNPCSENNGGCPVESTICVFIGPNQSSCQCKSGMLPVGDGPESGCQLVSSCSADSCHSTATCGTTPDGQTMCVCGSGQIGDGWRCYGNLMEQLIEVDRSGSHRGNLTGAIALFNKGCSLLLNHNGPFTMFIPQMKTPLTGVDEEVVCKNHLILGEHLYEDLRGRDMNLYGGGFLRTKDHKRFIVLDNPSRPYTVIQENLPAANGVIHIIDRPIITTVPKTHLLDEKFADKTIDEILRMDEKFNRFLSLVDNCGSPPPLRGPGPLTIFIPTNQAVDAARDGSILYMLNDAKHKLQELLRHHAFSQAALTVDDLVTLPQIHTMANQIININVSDDGQILLGEKQVHLKSTNIVASNGIIHMIDGLLYPPSILPILPHRCDVIENKITVGPCVHCSYLYETNCPDGSTEMESHLTGCDYVISEREHVSSKGCAKYCNTTKKTLECCKGFYGPDCKPCIGGFQHPCYDKGSCLDGIHGNGSCSCHPGFEGIACHICSDPTKHGNNCDEDCHCVHGVCDNRPGSNGICQGGSCKEGYSGENCDKMATPCNADGLMEHCHINAYCTQTGLRTTCVCKDGYEGDGHSCTLVNPCLKNHRGGCDINAECVFTGPNMVSCVCAEGWSGDGKVCVEINNCQMDSRGGCSANANCIHIGPAQSECVCKTGYMGDGKVCDLINPCLRNGGCHDLATCEVKVGGTHTCTCPDGFAGDGNICYGSILEELDMNIKFLSFYRLIQKDSKSIEDLSGNVTVLAPSAAALRNMTPSQNLFWTSRHHLSHFLRAHFLHGIHSVEDLDRLVGSRVSTLSPPIQWEISNSSGMIRIGNASILTHNLPATNGYIHIIDQILAPPCSDVSPEPPNLMDFLNSTTNFTLFRQFALMFNLSGDLGVSDFTLLLPTDEAIRIHLSSTNTSVLDQDTMKYHVIQGDLLFPDHLSDGMMKSTLLGSAYQVQFHLNDQNQTMVNDVPLDGKFTETQYGVIMVLNQVLKVRQNRCNKPVTLQVNGRCSDCNGPPRCLFSYKPIRSQFPVNMKSNCNYRKRVRSWRKSVPGCVIKCFRTTMDHSCCPGYYGHECFKCPGDVGNWCSNHGECQDGNQGDGECRCYEGFHGTACEDCEPGRYGLNCTSKCVCDHGKCEDGLEGSGRCECYKGWKGASCSVEIKDDACGGVCHENANCITGPKGTAAVCVCVAGYQGNGTHCRELDLCSHSNGGCSEFAVCTKVSAGERTCTCNHGYSGDGVVCLEVNGCRVNNGGCHESAVCIRTGPNTTACRCMHGFQGSGRMCSPVNPCLKNNGGCHKFAMCKNIGVGKRNCSCRRGYIGDGFECRGNTRGELSHGEDNAFFREMMQEISGIHGLYGVGPFTVFSPVPQTNSISTINQWQRSGRLIDLLHYHVVACEKLTLNDLTTTQHVIATSGHSLHFSQNQGSVWINNQSQIVRSDYTTTDGVIHYIDTLLTPYKLQDKPKINTKTMNLTLAAAFYGYTRFYKLIEDAGLVPLLQMSIHQPFTMLWPSDQALDSLPPEQQHWLSSSDHQEKLAATVKAHIIRNIKFMSLGQPDKFRNQYRTMHGSTIKFRCDRNTVGEVLINNNDARLVERYLMFREGMAYGIDHLLEPPGLGAHCDGIENKTKNGRCGSCQFTPSCPFNSIDTGRTERCNKYQPLYRDFSLYFSHRSYLTRNCQRVCLYTSWTLQCCKNHYGRDCQVCPGGLESPCSNHGNCNDGRQGTGKCNCYYGFTGTACEQCQGGFYGPNCIACNCTKMGSCDDGSEGSGQCVCMQGWVGDQCQTEVGSLPEECRQCDPQATCLPSVGCQCEAGFQGNGTFCIPEPPPDLCSEYNGGCHLDADCNQTGVMVTCSCRTGYQGDGNSCEPINRCVTETNGGCSDFSTCTFTGPNERDCECLPGYVGNGIKCMEKVVPPVDRCLEDNGGCDRVAVCKDLHYHVNQAGVFHLRSPDGKYKLNFSQADAACQAEGAVLASYKQLGYAQQLGMHLCVAGWMEGAKVGYPIRFPSDKCGFGQVGVIQYKNPVDQNSTYDVYCYRMRDVSCTCPDGYVGNGDFCNGVLVDVLAESSNFTIFYKFLVEYSSLSLDGKQLIEFLSHKNSDVTLFVPHDNGFTSNQTLSGRDLAYHISTNHSRRLFKDLKHQEIIKSRLGFNLTVTHSNNQSCKLVNQRLLVDWDIPAVNGIIHVIEAPLMAPPPMVSPHRSRGHTLSSSSASLVIVSVLLVCVLAVLGYYVFKHKPDAFGFHYFRNEEEGSEEGVRPALVSIPNPLYNASRSFTDPFGESGPEVDPSDPQNPPKILDLEPDLDPDNK